MRQLTRNTDVNIRSSVVGYVVIWEMFVGCLVNVTNVNSVIRTDPVWPDPTPFVRGSPLKGVESGPRSDRSLVGRVRNGVTVEKDPFIGSSLKYTSLMKSIWMSMSTASHLFQLVVNKLRDHIFVNSRHTHSGVCGHKDPRDRHRLSIREPDVKLTVWTEII